jgi:hypothetical protein
MCVILAHGLTGALYLNLQKIQISKLLKILQKIWECSQLYTLRSWEFII